MENKKKYIAPAIKCVEFKVEQGYAQSLFQGMSNWEEKPSDLTADNFDTYYEGKPFKTGGHFGGYFTGNNDDWD